MTPSKLLDWRKTVVYTHRWLGIVGTLIFLTWFASGIVLMYADMPGLSAEERLLRMAPLDLTAVRVTPAEAARLVDAPPTRMRVAMVGARPAFRFLSRSVWVGVYADTGTPIEPLSSADAVATVRRFVPDHQGPFRHEARLVDSDLWSFYTVIRSQMPLHRIALDDDAGTEFYVTEATGDVILKTTSRGRAWGFASAVPHWFYIPALRRQTALWRDLIIWTSLLGCVMCLSGLFWGVWRFSYRRAYRLEGAHSVSPYAGMMRWHHYTGLAVGLFGFTWALSGAMSFSPFAALRPQPWTAAQLTAAAGGPFDVSLVTIDGLRASAAAIGHTFPVKELEYIQFQGEPYFLAYRPTTSDERLPGMTGDVTGVLDPARDRDHLIVSALRPTQGAFAMFDRDAMLEVARRAMPGLPILSALWLDRYDEYYYGRKIRRPLPVLRIQFDDAEKTLMYLDPQHGRIAARLEWRERWTRWLYHGLHSLDFPALYNRRPLWDAVMIVLSLGGIALSATTFMAGLRRLRRHGRAWGSVAGRLSAFPRALFSPLRWARDVPRE